PLSLVASLLVCGLGLQVSYGLLAGRSVAPDAAAIDSFILVENTRGAERPPLSAQPPYLFQIDAGPGTANTRVTLDLRAADGRPLLHLAEVPVDGNGWARLVVQQTLSGSYTLEVTAGSGAVLQRFDLSLSE